MPLSASQVRHAPLVLLLVVAGACAVPGIGPEYDSKLLIVGPAGPCLTSLGAMSDLAWGHVSFGGVGCSLFAPTQFFHFLTLFLHLLAPP